MEWDEKEWKVEQLLNQSRLFVEYLHFQTEKCFKKESRDFIVLKTERKEVRIF
jgi:hypothetical protein